MEESGVVLLDLRSLLEAAPDGIAVVDEHGRIQVVNQRFSSLFGYSTEQLVGRSVDALVPERLRGAHAVHRNRYAAHPTTRPMGMGLHLWGLRSDGVEFPIEISLSPVESDGRTFTIAIVRDITDRRNLEADQQALQTVLDTEEERYRIGMDLHDGVMQDIYAVALGLDLAYEDIDTDKHGAKDAIGRSIDQLHSIIRDIRSYIFDLRPRQYTGDLAQALLDLGREFQENSGIHTDVYVPSDLEQVDASIGVTLYVISHEALSNTRKYAGANQVDIRLHVNGSALDLEVRDNGGGFDTSIEPTEDHRGLRNMASRARIIGADLRIESSFGEGTAVRVSVPIS